MFPGNYRTQSILIRFGVKFFLNASTSSGKLVPKKKVHLSLFQMHQRIIVVVQTWLPCLLDLWDVRACPDRHIFMFSVAIDWRSGRKVAA